MNSAEMIAAAFNDARLNRWKYIPPVRRELLTDFERGRKFISSMQLRQAGIITRNEELANIPFD